MTRGCVPDRARNLLDSGIVRVYLGGPMTGFPQFNFPAFFEGAEVLRAWGFDVVSPAELDNESTRAAALASVDGAPGTGSANGEVWEDFLARDIILLAQAVNPIQAGVFLDGWTKSRGANLEAAVLKSLGKGVYRYPSLAPAHAKPIMPYDWK